MDNLRDQFLLDPDIIYLNHGSFGATPRPVFDDYQAWQRRLEDQPVRFLARELPQHLARSRQVLAEFVGAEADDLVYIPNVTFGVNVVARSLSLGLGDEVLTTDHEYGACMNAWRYLSERHGFSLRPLAIPLRSISEDIVDQFTSQVTPKTRVIYLSHLTSPTAIELPVEEICALAAEAGIITVIDGAHAPGQVDLDLAAIGADFYIGNCHKWLCAPKGSAFLHTAGRSQHLVEPLVVGWGWGQERAISYGSDFLDYLQWLGTHDPAAYLAVPSAIAFFEQNDWIDVRDRCHELLSQALRGIEALTGSLSHYNDHRQFHQMAAAVLPHVEDVREAQVDFYERYRIEIPFIQWSDQQLIRVSIQGYNTLEEVERFLNVFGEFF